MGLPRVGRWDRWEAREAAPEITEGTAYRLNLPDVVAFFVRFFSSVPLFSPQGGKAPSRWESTKA